MFDRLAEWLAGNGTDSMIWSTRVTDTTVFHQFNLQNPVAFGIESGHALDSSGWYAMLGNAVCPIVISPASDYSDLAQPRRVTYMTDSDENCRTRFNSTGTLTNATNSGPKAIAECVTSFVL